MDYYKNLDDPFFDRLKEVNDDFFTRAREYAFVEFSSNLTQFVEDDCLESATDGSVIAVWTEAAQSGIDPEKFMSDYFAGNNASQSRHWRNIFSFKSDAL